MPWPWVTRTARYEGEQQWPLESSEMQAFEELCKGPVRTVIALFEKLPKRHWRQSKHERQLEGRWEVKRDHKPQIITSLSSYIKP